MELIDTLQSSLTALRAPDRATALETMLTAWRACRDGRLADAIGELSADLTRSLPPIAGKTLKARQEMWIDVEAKRRSIDLGRLG